MEPIPEAEELHSQLQANRIGFVDAEINLISTFLEMSHAEYKLGFVEAGAKSLDHAKEAIAGAGKGLSRIESAGQRAVFERRLQELAVSIRNFKIPE